MVELNVLKILKDKGKTKYWLYNKFDMTYTNFDNFVTNKTKSIRYENIEKLCNILECEPNDLFIFKKDKNSK